MDYINKCLEYIDKNLKESRNYGKMRILTVHTAGHIRWRLPRMKRVFPSKQKSVWLQIAYRRFWREQSSGRSTGQERSMQTCSWRKIRSFRYCQGLAYACFWRKTWKKWHILAWDRRSPTGINCTVTEEFFNSEKLIVLCNTL